MRAERRGLAALAMALALGACAGRLEHPERFGIVGRDAGTPRDADVTDADVTDAGLGEDVPSMLADACGTAGCHGAEAPALGLDLASPGLAARLSGATSAACMGRALVTPTTPDASLLLEKVRDESPACGARMPIGGAPLDAARIAALRAWIAAL